MSKKQTSNTFNEGLVKDYHPLTVPNNTLTDALNATFVTMNGNDYRKTDFTGGVALVIGAEEDGISRLVAEKCDYTVSLPMKGKIESLNASVAAGIMMYRVLECRK